MLFVIEFLLASLWKVGQQLANIGAKSATQVKGTGGE
jgi:hypothetical protein